MKKVISLYSNIILEWNGQNNLYFYCFEIQMFTILKISRNLILNILHSTKYRILFLYRNVGLAVVTSVWKIISKSLKMHFMFIAYFNKSCSMLKCLWKCKNVFICKPTCHFNSTYPSKYYDIESFIITFSSMWNTISST